jgi:tetratricopeptide (TPR) repeat protein
MPTAPIPNFHGRAAELAQLRYLFQDCATRDPTTGRFGGPRMAVVIAESGIGKTRLVQALYQQLTTDLQWDPPEVNYWPDAFNDAGVQLRVTPNMAGHVAQGPPRFAWLGARFHATDIRNLSERRSSLTELRHSIMTHAEILRAHGSAWADATGRIRQAIAREGVGETISQVADAAVPFGGLLAKLIAGGVKLVRDRTTDAKSVGEASDDASKTLVDDVEESMRSLLDGKGGLPSILWLDDAQWIDSETQSLLNRVWRIANERGWPLFVVVTHWERPWRELRRQPPGERGLVSFAGQPGVSIIELQDAEPEALRSYLKLHMPGLTQGQQYLMLEKAAGNFLTMVENVGQLLRVPGNFVERRTTGALCPAGECVVREWQSERHRRVEQRFTELAPEVQDLLGWSSHLGVSFLHEVVEEFADQFAGKPGAAIILRDCVDPLAILGRPNELLREFRDRAFHAVAKHHFGSYGKEQAAPLEAILREHLAEWVNNSFGVDGKPLLPIEQRDRSALSLPDEERRDFLGMAVTALRPRATDAWGDARSIAWVRAMYLLMFTDWMETLWDRVQQHANELASAHVDWNMVPETALEFGNRGWLASIAATAGALDCATDLWTAEISRARAVMAEVGTRESRRDVLCMLVNIGSTEQLRGDLDGALCRYKEALSIASALQAELATIESRCDVSNALAQIACIEYTRGDLDGALAHFKQSLEIDSALVAELGTPESRRTLSLSLDNVAAIEQARGDIDGALVRYEGVLRIRRALLATMATPESRRDVSVSLHRIANIEESRGDVDSALSRFKEALGIARALMAEVGTPESLRDVSVALVRIAGIEEARGDVDTALARYEECLAIDRALMAKLGTPESRRAVHFALVRMANIEDARGDVDSAFSRYQEALGIARVLMSEIGAPDVRRYVIAVLYRIAEIEKTRGDLESALSSYEELLAWQPELEAVVGNLDSQVSLISVNYMVWIAQMCAGIEVSLSRAEAALVRLEAVLEQACALESSIDAEASDTAAAYWECRTAALEALGWVSEAAESRDRAAALRIRIAEMGGE